MIGKILRTSLLLLLVRAATAQQPPPAATGSIRGVVEQPTGAPLAKATVELWVASGSGSALTSVTTESDGKFVFPKLPPGSYKLVATRSGWVRTEFGQRQSQGPGRLISLAAGQEIPVVRLTMTAAAVISGRVTDRGKPMRGADVYALKSIYNDGQFRLIPTISTKTNDLGEYHLFWLPPGRYYIAAVVYDVNSRSMINNLNGSSPSRGEILNPDGVDDSPFSIAPSTISVSGLLNRASANPFVSETEAHVPMFFPGTPHLEDATPIEVGSGAEIRNLDLIAPAVALRHVRGVVIGAPPTAAGQPVRVLLHPLAGTNPDIASGQADANGSFDIPRIPPGSYMLTVSAAPLTTSFTVEVRDRDLNLSVPLDPGFELTGRLVIEKPVTGGSGPAISDLRVLFRRVPPLQGQNQTGGAVATNTPDGLFKATMTRGDYRVLVSPILQPRTNPGLQPQALPVALDSVYVKSIRLGDVDVLNDGLHIQSQPPDPLVVVVGTNPGAIAGRVFNDEKQPMASVWVALIPDGGLRFRVDHKFASTDESGGFQLRNVPPGNYKVFAWESVEHFAWQEPDFMRRFEASGTSIHVDEGVEAAIDVIAIRARN